MKRFWQLLVLGYTAFAVPATVSAQVLGINFASTDPDEATSSLLPTESAGVINVPNWNNLTTNTGSGIGGLVYDNNGTSVPSTATVTWNGPPTWRSGANNQLPAGPQRKLMSGYLDTGNTAATGITVTVDNIDAALRSSPYDVYVYFVSDSNANRGGGYTLTPQGGTPILKYGSTMGAPTAHIEDPGTDADISIDGTYLKFTGLSAPSFTIVTNTEQTTPNGFRAPINAIQISRAMDGDVNGDRVVNLADFHIIRGNLFKTAQSRAQGDLAGGNNFVDFADYRAWRAAAPPGLAASVSLTPEPSAFLLFAIGAASVALGRCRAARTSLLMTR